MPKTVSITALYIWVGRKLFLVHRPGYRPCALPEAILRGLFFLLTPFRSSSESFVKPFLIAFFVARVVSRGSFTNALCRPLESLLDGLLSRLVEGLTVGLQKAF